MEDDYIFTGDRFGYLHQYKLTKKSKEQQSANQKYAAFYNLELFKDYGKVLEGMFISLTLAKNNSFLLAAGGLGNLKRMRREHDYEGNRLDTFTHLEIYTKGIPNDKDFYHAFSEAHDGPVSSISVTLDDNIITTGHKGHTKTWN